MKKLVNLAVIGSLLIPVSTFANTLTLTSGTWYNEPGQSTVFSSPTGINIPTGVTIRGLESIGGVPTGNGGSFIFNTPNFNLGGIIDVSAAMSGVNFIGNGGSVTVNTSSYTQSGSIFANGLVGGLVNLNANTFNMLPGSSIEANGTTGSAGRVVINNTGVTDIQNTAVIMVNGKPLADQDLSNVEVLGSIVNLSGIVKANGIMSKGGKIQLVAKNGDLTITNTAIIEAKGDGGEGFAHDGGTVKLAAHNGVINNNGTLDVSGGTGYTLNTTTQTVVVQAGESGTVDNFNKNASPDNVDLNDLNLNSPQSYIVQGFDKNVSGGVVTVPDVTVTATYSTVNNKDVVTITIKDQNNNILFSKAYDKNDAHDQHIELSIPSEFTKNGITVSTTVVRDFNVTISKLDNKNQNPNANVVLLPQFQGGEYNIPEQTETITTTTRTPIQGSDGTISQSVTSDPPSPPPPPSPNPPSPPSPPPTEEPPKENPKPVVSVDKKPEINVGQLLYTYPVQYRQIKIGGIVVISFKNESMFFSKTYTRTREFMLDLALKTYKDELSLGATEQEAFETVKNVLLLEGFNKNVVVKLKDSLTNSERDQFIEKQFNAIMAVDDDSKESASKNLKNKELIFNVPTFVGQAFKQMF